jgi:hypothetical protein
MSSTPIQLQQPDRPHLFQKGHPRYGGRKKGSKNRFGGDLRETIVAAIQATGFIEKDDEGNLIATGKRGCQGFVEWLALHEPKTAAALFARVLPQRGIPQSHAAEDQGAKTAYFIVSGEAPEVASEAEVEAQLQELGLPIGLIEHMQVAPAPLDLDEDPDPYGLMKDVSVPSNGTGGDDA